MPARKYFPNDWVEAIGLDNLNSHLMAVSEALIELRQHSTIFPAAGDPLLFQAFRSTPFDAIRVVILGQDPYHDGSFNGLAFGNGKEHGPWPKKLSPSLKHILQEVERTEKAQPTPDLYLWANEGVLLINTSHTVVEGIAGSHLELWRPFTAEIIKALNKKSDLIWMLWGGKAKGYKDQINATHKILEAGHPSPLNSVIPFAGCGHFEKCNDYFSSKNKSPITWVLPF